MREIGHCKANVYICYFHRYYHIEKSPDFYYIAMELAAGTVDDFIKGREDNFGKPFPKTDGITIIRDASTGLAWLHTKNISKLFSPFMNL